MTHTVKSDRKPVANDALYHCTGKASGGWGVHQAYDHDCTATSPETATKAHMWAPNGHTYGCYFGCSPCEPVCVEGATLARPTVTGAGALREAWSDHSDAWSDRTYDFESLGHFTSGNFQYNVETTVNSRNTGEIQITAPFDARIYSVSERDLRSFYGTGVAKDCGTAWKTSTQGTWTHQWTGGTGNGYIKYNLQGHGNWHIAQRTYTLTWCMYVDVAAGQQFTIKANGGSPHFNGEKQVIFITNQCNGQA